MTEKRKKAIIRRRIFIAIVAAVLAAFIAIVAVVVVALKDKGKQTNNESGVSSQDTVSVSDTQVSEPASSQDNMSQSEPAATASSASKTDDTKSSTPSQTADTPQNTSKPVDTNLDPDFGRLLLINGENPLPDEYDTAVRQYLVEIDSKYRNNNYVTQIHRDVYPYITAMVAAAQADGVDLKVWSPFRSYSIQNDLFQRQVARMGGDEQKAVTVVARPGTSEHNTGLCADFNMADDAFESKPMYKWMCENAENYGFILRYPKDKQSVTGVIYESWHWRFVGINNAKEINKLGVTLEEYVKMKNLDPKMDMYGDDDYKGNQ